MKVLPLISPFALLSMMMMMTMLHLHAVVHVGRDGHSLVRCSATARMALFLFFLFELIKLVEGTTWQNVSKHCCCHKKKRIDSDGDGSAE
jgi:hypothetical protein